MEGLVPDPSGLTDAIDALVETADIGFMTRNDVTFRLSDVDLFINSALKECGLHVK